MRAVDKVYSELYSVTDLSAQEGRQGCCGLENNIHLKKSFVCIELCEIYDC